MRLLLVWFFFLLLAEGNLSFSGLCSACVKKVPVRTGWRGLAQGPTCNRPFRSGNLLAERPFSVVPTPCSSSRRSALLRFLSSGPVSDGGAEERDQASGQLEAAEGKTNAVKKELKSAEGKLKTAEGKLEAAKKDFKTAEGKLEAAEGKLEAAEGKLEAATDPQQKALTQKACDRAEKAYELAVKNVNTARENLNRAGRAVDIALDALQRAGAGPTVVPAPPGKQVAGAVPESGLRQVLRRSCPMGVECECAQMRNTHRTSKLTWRNQRIIGAILENGTVPVFLEREAQMEQVIRLMLKKQRDWCDDKQKNPLFCVPNSPGTGKSLFAAMLGQALEAGCLEGRSVAEVVPTLTAANDAGDGNFTTVVSAFTYNSAMTAQMNLGSQCAALFCRALYGALGAKCSQLSTVSFDVFADAARAQEMWGARDQIRREYKALTGGAEKENANFVLLVDELAKIDQLEDPSDSARQTLTELGAWLDASPTHHAVVTALHEQFVRRGVTGSNRNVEIATIVTDLSCVNGNAEALVPVFCQALNVSTPTPPLRQNLQRIIALTSGHVRSLEKLHIGLSSNENLRKEVLKGRRAEWQTLALLSLLVWANDVGSVVLEHLKERTQREMLWRALSQVVLVHSVETFQFQPLIESGAVQLAGNVPTPTKLTETRIDAKALVLLSLLHAASTPGCYKLDPCVLKLSALLFDDAASETVIEGLPSSIAPTASVNAFGKRRMSSAAERVVSWGVARILEGEAALRSKLLGTTLDSTPTPKNVSIVLPLPEEDYAAFNRRLSALDANEWAIHLAPDYYPATDLYAVRRINEAVQERVAVQVKINWNSSTLPEEKQTRISRIRKRAHNVKVGDGPLQVLTASRFVLVICSEAVSKADIDSLTAHNTTSDEQPVDVVLVGEDLARVLPRSLMRLTWMGIPIGEDDDSDADELDG